MTDVPIDKSNLPRVNEVCRDFAVLEDGALAHCLQEQEIEQHYASNIRKNKLVQKDIRIAKKLQDEEDLQCKVFSLEKQKQIEEQDSEYARAIQEELQRKALECLQREEEDKEIAKRLQQLEEEELQKKKQDWSRGDEEPKPSFDIDPLDWKMAELHVRNSDQLIQDEELARQLQEEEEKRLAKLKHRENPEDFRAAQVAQDEEIAKYIQQQELKAHRRSEDLELRESDDDGSICSFSERRNLGIKNEVPSSNQGRLDSEGLATPTECRTPERMDHSTAEGTIEQARLRSPRNIAEELDPTFKSKKEPSNEVFAVYSQEFPVPSQTQALPVDGFYELMDDGAEPIFIPPTKRQSEKLGRSKPKDKKEGCKQQ